MLILKTKNLADGDIDNKGLSWRDIENKGLSVDLALLASPLLKKLGRSLRCTLLRKFLLFNSEYQIGKTQSPRAVGLFCVSWKRGA